MSKIFKIFFDIVFIILILILCVYFALRLFGIAEIYEVKTGSMEDGIHAGDYILILKKNNYKVGDVVTYTKDDYYVTHRIIKKDECFSGKLPKTKPNIINLIFSINYSHLLQYQILFNYIKI